MRISSVIKISFCRISFSGHQNKFCACLDSIYGSRVILVMCKNCSDISWHRLNLNQSKTNCPKNLNSDGLIVREMGSWPECIFRSLLQFLVFFDMCLNKRLSKQSSIRNAGDLRRHRAHLDVIVIRSRFDQLQLDASVWESQSKFIFLCR